MNLKSLAEHFAHETFEAFDEGTETFIPVGLTGRVSLVDRFQSIYNKPLRRRTLFHNPDTRFPDSFTIRNAITGATYLLGQTRHDGRADEGKYHSVTVLHLVTPEYPGPAAGLVTVMRKVARGPADDPGWLVEAPVAKHYADFEFRTSKAEDGTYEVDLESYVVHFPRHAQLERNDFIDFDGRRLRIEVAMPDSGFTLVRADEEDDSRVDMILHHTAGARVYNETTHRYEDNVRKYNFTGDVITDYNMGTWLSDATSYIDVVVDQGHIGVQPIEGDLVEYKGVTRVVKRVEQHGGRRQYRMRCE